MDIVEVVEDGHIRAVEELAREIWREHYTPIIGRPQVDYMLDKLQSAAAIAGQIKDGCRYYLLRDNGRDIGYFGIQSRRDTGTLFLSKLYVTAAARGRGHGKRALDFIEQFARGAHLKSITLFVNKKNFQSIRVYEAAGFHKAEAVVNEIGGGFVMDDYRMEKLL